MSARESSRYSGGSEEEEELVRKSRWKGSKFCASSFESGEDPSKLVRN